MCRPYIYTNYNCSSIYEEQKEQLAQRIQKTNNEDESTMTVLFFS